MTETEDTKPTADDPRLVQRAPAWFCGEHLGTIRGGCMECIVREKDARIAELTKERDEARGISWECDACGGDGTPPSGLPCMCSGSGRAVDAMVYLRSQLAKVTEERDNARAAADIAERYPQAHEAQARLASYEKVVEAAEKVCLRIEELSEFYYDLADAPEGAVPAWDLVALAKDSARVALQALDQPTGGEE